MKANELRVGNKFKFIDRTVTISGILSIGVCFVEEYSASDEINIDDLKPIPLTEELLRKADYQYANENGQKFYWHTDLPYFQLRRDEDSWLMWHHETGESEILVSNLDIEYAHQLQNVHFILSGEELIIK